MAIDVLNITVLDRLLHVGPSLQLRRSVLTRQVLDANNDSFESGAIRFPTVVDVVLNIMAVDDYDYSPLTITLFILFISPTYESCHP